MMERKRTIMMQAGKDGDSRKGHIEITERTRRELHVVEVRNGEWSRVKLDYPVYMSRITGALGGNEETSDVELDPFDNQSLVGIKSGGEWIFALENGSPTPEQAWKIGKKNRSFGADIYPSEPIAVGHRWKVSGAEFLKWYGDPDAQGVGSLSMHFRAIEEIDGVKCAVIDIEERFQLVTEIGHESKAAMEIEFDGTGVLYRSLDTHLDVKWMIAGEAEIKRSIFRASGSLKKTGSETLRAL